MATQPQPKTVLAQRMLEDLLLRNYSPNTIDCYLRHVAQCAQHFRTSPDRLGPEHIRTYQQFLITHKRASWSTCTQAVCAPPQRITEGLRPHRPMCAT